MSAFQKGYNAFFAHKKRTDNPYTNDVNSLMVIDWYRGFDVATKDVVMFNASTLSQPCAGWKLVPSEPTAEMIYEFWGEITQGEPELDYAIACYKNMLKKVPSHR